MLDPNTVRRRGSMNQRVTLQAPEAPVDELGQNARHWADIATVYAKVTETAGREFLKGDYQAERKAVFQIRWRQIDSTARVLWEGQAWRILSVTGTRRERFLSLQCEATDTTL